MHAVVNKHAVGDFGDRSAALFGVHSAPSRPPLRREKRKPSVPSE